MRRRLGKLTAGIAPRLGLFGEVSSFDSSPNPFVGIYIALNHERRGRFRRFVRMAGIKRRRWVVLDSELNSLRERLRAAPPMAFTNDLAAGAMRNRRVFCALSRIV